MTTIFWPHEGGLGQICVEEAGGQEPEPRATDKSSTADTAFQCTASDRGYRGFHNYESPWFGPGRRRF